MRTVGAVPYDELDAQRAPTPTAPVCIAPAHARFHGAGSGPISDR